MISWTRTKRCPRWWNIFEKFHLVRTSSFYEIRIQVISNTHIHTLKKKLTHRYSKLLKWIHDSKTKSIAMKSRLSQILCEFVRGVIYNEKEEFEMSSPLSIVMKALKILERCIALSNVRYTQPNTNNTRIRIEGSSQNALRLRQVVKDLQDSNVSTDDDTSCIPFVLKSLRTYIFYGSFSHEQNKP